MIETFPIKRNFFKQNWPWLLIGFLALLLLSLLFIIWQFSKPAKNFPTGEVVVVPRGLTAIEITNLLEENHVVRSSTFLYLVLLWRHDPSGVQAGTFLFQEPLSVFKIADRITSPGDTKNLVSLTLPEGFTLSEYAEISAKVLPDFSTEQFLKETDGLEGMLFPDTYFVPVDFTTEEIVTLLKDTYEQKISSLRDEINKTNFSEYEILILASLIEREANTEESMRIVSGILQNRLDEGMRLQVDASLEYILNRPLHTLTAEDLEIDSSYNTYLYNGLPPTPIGNPGLQSIRAVLDPIESQYFFYITDKDGNFYYSKTFDEHQDNIAKYLR